MPDRPLLLDLFCGAGGAAVGYQRAGFEVVGVDIAPQPRYPFEFHQADALSILRSMVDYPSFSGELWRPDYWDAIHASPPCQAYSSSTAPQRNRGKEYPDLIGPTRDLLLQVGRPWVIENVPGAPMRADYRLCGCMFDLPLLKRERWFETSWHGFDMRPPCHHPVPIVTVIGHGPNQHSAYRDIPGCEWAELKRRAMDIDWMSRDELGQAIPPAYTQHIGEQLLAHIRGEVVTGV